MYIKHLEKEKEGNHLLQLLLFFFQSPPTPNLLNHSTNLIKSKRKSVKLLILASRYSLTPEKSTTKGIAKVEPILLRVKYPEVNLNKNKWGSS